MFGISLISSGYEYLKVKQLVNGVITNYIEYVPGASS